MSAILAKCFDFLTCQVRKIPYIMMVLFIFTFMFPTEANIVKNLLITKGKLLLPESFGIYFAKLQISFEDLLFLWFFFLVLFLITFLLDLISNILREETRYNMNLGTEILLEINSIFLLSILIYNTLYDPGIRLSQVFLSQGYWTTLLFSGFLFVLAFFFNYCSNVIRLYIKIIESHISTKSKLILSLLPSIFFTVIASKIVAILFR